MAKALTIWEQAQLQGHSRRDFLQFCTWLAAAAGIESSAVGQVVHALETKRGKPVAKLVECRLETGRTHQIRVHLAHLGHPILGDGTYATGYRTKASLLSAKRGLPRPSPTWQPAQDWWTKRGPSPSSRTKTRWKAWSPRRKASKASSGRPGRGCPKAREEASCTRYRAGSPARRRGRSPRRRRRIPIVSGGEAPGA